MKLAHVLCERESISYPKHKGSTPKFSHLCFASILFDESHYLSGIHWLCWGLK